jgi:hypothetical protein
MKRPKICTKMVPDGESPDARTCPFFLGRAIAMNQLQSPPLDTVCHELERALDSEDRERHAPWADDVHFLLGQLAATIQEDVGAAEMNLEAIDAINPDFQNAPVTERHNLARRAQLITLGEKIHQLRAELRCVRENQGFDLNQMRGRGKEICASVEKIHRASIDFLQTTLNSNPGAGE